MQLCTGVIVNPEFVTGRQWTVDRGRNPVIGASGLERNCAMCVAKARDARGRVVVIRGSALRKKKSSGQGKHDNG